MYRDKTIDIVALECKPANSKQGNFTGQRKKQTEFSIVVMEGNYFSHFFLQHTIVILSSSFGRWCISFSFERY